MRRGKRRNKDLTVRDILLETVPWAVLEEEANVALAPLSVEDRSLFENSSLIERIVERENMFKAYDRVVKNKGSAGIDKMSVGDLKPYLQKEWVNIKIKLLDGKYQPQPVKQVEIPKPGGGVRKLGIPTVVDRLIQQSLHQELDLIFDAGFSDSSYGFRKGRSAHQAVEQFRKHVASGKKWVVDIDLEKFFDLVNHDVLLARVERKVKDKKVLKLIRSYLKVGYLKCGQRLASSEGMPQGGPLSPILSNILLDDLDKELEERGHSFTRYADDLRIYVSSRKAGDRVMKSVSNYLVKVLRLRVNQEKSQVVKARYSSFLGYSVTHHKVPKLRVPKQSLQKV